MPADRPAVGLLGPVTLFGPDGRELPVGGVRQQVLLARLALDAPRLVTTDALVDALWGDEPPAGTSNALQSQVSRLRRLLRLAAGNPELLSSPAGYRLAPGRPAADQPAPDHPAPGPAVPDHPAPDRPVVDAALFTRLVEQGRAAAAAGDTGRAGALLTRAETLWRGPALAGLTEVPFAAAAAAHLDALRLDAAELRLRIEVERGRHGEVLAELERLAALHPLHEGLRALWMEALARSGRGAEALAVFEQTRRLLADELGADPSARLRSVHGALLRGEFDGPAATALSPAGPPSAPQPPAGAVSPPPGQASPGPSPGRHPLPAPLTRLIGREAELGSVLDALARHRLVTLTGPGGAGKTRLALAAADHLLSSPGPFPPVSLSPVLPAPASPAAIPPPVTSPALPSSPREVTPSRADPPPPEVLFVELAAARDAGQVEHALLDAVTRPGLALLDPAVRPAAVARAADTGEAAHPPAAPGRPVLVAALRHRHALIVLDNCEHLLPAVAEVVEEVLRLCPQVRVLTTSREPLGIIGERLVPVGPLALPPPDTPWEAARGFPAVELFLDRALAVRPDLPVAESTVTAAVEICRRLDGLPLAIELAAARLRSVPVRQLAVLLDDRFRLLRAGTRTAHPRHRTLHAVVAWSWDLLDGAERAVLRRLAVAPAGLTLEAAEYVCAGWPGGPDGEPGASPEPYEVLDVLAALVDKSLVVAVPDIADREPGPPRPDQIRTGPAGEERPEVPGYRYRMLETIRAFAAEMLQAAGEAETARERHARWCAGLARAARPRLVGADQLVWIRRLSGEHDNLLAAARWAIETGRPEYAFQLGATLGWLWTLQGRHGMVLRWIGEIVAMPGSAAGRSPASGAAAEGAEEPAAPAGPEAVALARAEAGMHVVLLVNAGILQEEKQREQLIAAAELALRRAQATYGAPGEGAADHGAFQVPDLEDEPLLLLGLALIRAFWSGDRAGVLSETEPLLASSHPWARAAARLMRGMAAHLQRDITAARTEFAAAAELYRRTGDRWGMFQALSQSAVLASLGGDHQTAADAFAQAADLAAEIEAWDDAAVLRLQRAMALVGAGRLADTRSEIEHARRLAARHGPGIAAVLLDLVQAEVARRCGDRPAADAGYRRMLTTLDLFGPAELAVHACCGLALTAAAAGDWADAAAWHRQAADRLTGLGDPRLTQSAAAIWLEILAWTAWRTGAPPAAARLLGAAEEIRGILNRGCLEVVEAEDGLRAALGPAGFDEALRAGAAAVRTGPPDGRPEPSPDSPPDGGGSMSAAAAAQMLRLRALTAPVLEHLDDLGRQGRDPRPDRPAPGADAPGGAIPDNQPGQPARTTSRDSSAAGPRPS